MDLDNRKLAYSEIDIRFQVAQPNRTSGLMEKMGSIIALAAELTCRDLQAEGTGNLGRGGTLRCRKLLKQCRLSWCGCSRFRTASLPMALQKLT